ncbi:hypothetical protein Strvi_4617 [Streptomyces violaceusniger Tu 4113]|uniref:Uncharacterized protein n=1 Tax=Streptomyces violaceusniger (strain Tu 4113) TaxID=653045 RepID=G2PF67_STRV4|nr:hypothetical protein Strvi_4617 [Streptomyces violaceusniger Tu 4113]
MSCGRHPASDRCGASRVNQGYGPACMRTPDVRALVARCRSFGLARPRASENCVQLTSAPPDTAFPGRSHESKPIGPSRNAAGPADGRPEVARPARCHLRAQAGGVAYRGPAAAARGRTVGHPGGRGSFQRPHQGQWLHRSVFVPREVIRKRCALYMKRGKPAFRSALIHDQDRGRRDTLAFVARHPCRAPTRPDRGGRRITGPVARSRGPGALVDVAAPTSGVHPRRCMRAYIQASPTAMATAGPWLRFPAAATASCSLSQVSGNESALEDGALPGFSGGRASKSVTVRPGGGYPPERSVRKSAARILRGPAPVA